jgi:hypothetical protein
VSVASMLANRLRRFRTTLGAVGVEIAGRLGLKVESVPQAEFMKVLDVVATNACTRRPALGALGARVEVMK